MNHNHIISSRVSKNTPSTSSKPTKLKDSCDKCSASKVRCTKEKPSCTRCDKLCYVCSYSPARRVGRPIANEAVTQFVDESVKLYSRSNLAEVGTNLSSTGSHITSQANLSQPESTLGIEQSEQTQPHTTKHSDINPDCLIVALDLLVDLELSADQLRQASPIDVGLATTTTQMISRALCRLSDILTCSCFERVEVGMSVSALCMCVMDMHVMMMAPLARHPPVAVVFDQTNPWGNLGDESFQLGHETPVQVMEELSKVAQFILQFTGRYNNGREAQDGSRGVNSPVLPADYISSIADSLRQRMEQITQYTVDWTVGSVSLPNPIVD
ncbi:unnamed protein product [Penicillium salamii]|nr:unnamed protein product [Penicillium salamii]CAG8366284.1 unnamed protein product [Penicillium salamii]